MQHGPAGNHSKARRAASAGSTSSSGSGSALPMPVAPMAFPGLFCLSANEPVAAVHRFSYVVAGSRFLCLRTMLLANAALATTAARPVSVNDALIATLLTPNDTIQSMS